MAVAACPPGGVFPSPNRRTATALAGALALLVVGAAPTRAHHSPAERVSRLTAALAAAGADEIPPLLRERAAERRTLGDLEGAASDLERFLDLRPGDLDAHTRLAGIHRERGDFDEALDATVRAAGSGAPAAELAGLRIEQARIHLALGNLRDAGIACAAGLEASQQPRVDWFLLESEILRRQGLLDERASRLREARSRHASHVLEEAWIDAMIEAGRGSEVAAAVDGALEASRLGNAWQLRRGRILEAEGDLVGARACYRTALDELDRIVRPDRPDRELLFRQAEACARLGRVVRASGLLNRCRGLEMPSWRLEPVGALLAAAGPETPVQGGEP